MGFLKETRLDENCLGILIDKLRIDSSRTKLEKNLFRNENVKKKEFYEKSKRRFQAAYT